MKIDDHNLLLIGLLAEGGRAAALLKLNTYAGERIEVGDHVGGHPWEVLHMALQDARLLKADQCVIYSNAGLDVKRLALPKIETTWQRGPKPTYGYFKPVATLPALDVHPCRIKALHLLIKDYDRWQYIETTPANLQSTRRLLT